MMTLSNSSLLPTHADAFTAVARTVFTSVCLSLFFRTISKNWCS